MPKKLIIYTEPKIEASIVIFHVDEKEVHRKILTEFEMVHLSSRFNLTKMPVELDAEHVNEKIRQCPFVTEDGEPTHFELLLIDILEKR